MAYARNRYKNQLRTVSGSIVQENHDHNCSANTAAWNANWTGNYSYQVGKFTTMWDTVTPKYKERTANGEVIFSPMSSVSYEADVGYGTGTDVVSTTSDSCTTHHFHTSTRRTNSGVTLGRLVTGLSLNPIINFNQLWVPPSNLSNAEMSSLITEASTAAHNARGRHASDQYETIAELDKSMAMLSQAVKQLNDFTKRKSRVVQRAKAAGSAYLLYRYGFVPLMLAVEEAQKGVARKVGRMRESSRGYAKVNKTTTETYTRSQYGLYNVGYLVTKTERHSVRAMFLDDFDVSQKDALGLSNKNLATLPWELLPYSFVIDWAVNIGDFIGALVPALELRSLGSCTVLERKVTWSVASTSQSLLGGFWNVLVNPMPSHGATGVWTIKNRFLGVEDPGITIKSNLKLDSATRAFDAISLLILRLK